MTSLLESLPQGCKRGDDELVRSKAAQLGITAIACRGCGREFAISPIHVCEFCFGPLEIVYDYGHIRASVSRALIEAGPRSIWRYAPLLPAPDDQRIDLGTGFTPLRSAPRLAAELGIKKLRIKDESRNPTNSFKDRVVSVALTAARFFGYKIVACASTGNLANSLAAHAAASGITSIVFIPRDLEPNKVAASSIYEGLVFAIDGSYDDVNRLRAELVEDGPSGFVNLGLRPFYAEGSKTVGFEIAEQLAWRFPDALVAPVGSGSLITRIAKGFEEMNFVRLVDEGPTTRFFGAQAAGCSPIERAFVAGQSEVAPVRPETTVRSLAIGAPADGEDVLRLARDTDGGVAAVTDEEADEGVRLLARTEGIFTEGAGGVTVAVLEKLVAQGRVRFDDETVLVITGNGLKTIGSKGRPRTVLEVEPTVRSVAAAFGEPLSDAI